MQDNSNFAVPSSKEYIKALKKIKKSITDIQRVMLGRHLKALYYSMTFADLAKAAGNDDYQFAVNTYETLGQELGEQLKMNYLESVSRPGEPLYCSAFASGNPFRKEDAGYHLVLHREFVEALLHLKWFR